MASKAHNFDFFVDQSPAFDADARQRVASKPRIFHTWMTDQDFKDCGLQVFERRQSRSDWLRPVFDINDSISVEWLSRGPANDILSGTDDHDWLDAVNQRLDALRVIAVEEGLAFDEVSAAAAITFIKRFSKARQPGVFLIGGNIRLLWDRDGGEQVGLQFRGTDHIQYVVFQQDGSELGSTMGIKSHDAMLRLILGTEVGDIVA